MQLAVLVAPGCVASLAQVLANVLPRNCWAQLYNLHHALNAMLVCNTEGSLMVLCEVEVSVAMVEQKTLLRSHL